jgi:transposase-like protein
MPRHEHTRPRLLDPIFPRRRLGIDRKSIFVVNLWHPRTVVPGWMGRRGIRPPPAACRGSGGGMARDGSTRSAADAVAPDRSPLNRLRWTEQDAREVLAALGRSGKPVSVFAAEHGLEPQRGYFWRRRLGRAERTTFQELIVRSAGRPAVSDAAGSSFEIVFPRAMWSARQRAATSRSTTAAESTGPRRASILDRPAEERRSAEDPLGKGLGYLDRARRHSIDHRHMRRPRRQSARLPPPGLSLHRARMASGQDA